MIRRALLLPALVAPIIFGMAIARSPRFQATVVKLSPIPTNTPGTPVTTVPCIQGKAYSRLNSCVRTDCTHGNGVIEPTSPVCYSNGTVAAKCPCNNGIKEDCDDGNLEDGDGCSSKFKIEPGATCEKVQRPDGWFSTTCITPCGNGTIDAREKCDDGNKTGGDGCGKTCTVEQGWKCSGSPSSCKKK